MNKDFKLGMIVLSIQGRDKNEVYVVTQIQDNFVWVCNGTTKKLKNPKKKNKIHLKTTSVQNTEIAQKLEEGKKINDQMIYHSIHEFKKSKQRGD